MESLHRAEGGLQEEITFLFTDIEGSTRLWEQEPLRMQGALAIHDRLARGAVLEHRGTVVKMTGDGLHAAFDDAAEALAATLELQLALADPAATNGLALAVRCGLHSGPNERRDGDFYGGVVNRAARIMSAAHGGQVLLSRAVAEQLQSRLPPEVALRDLGLVRLRDLGTAEQLYEVVHPNLPRDFPPLRSLADTPNNLPHALTTFVGRERELDELREMLASHRLVSVVGMGGLGKTRLTLQLAAELLDDFPDGVWLVELAPLNDGRRVAEAIAAIAGVRAEAGRPIEDVLAAHVRSRRVLFLLDNCEHLLEHCARIAHLLVRAGDAVTVLGSSREPLRVTGEACYPIGVLAAPGPREALDPQAAARFESVRLFADRAAAAAPAFRLGADNIATIAAICHRLEGIPLAIELAAARVRSLSVQQIALRLDDRFRLLTAGDPTMLPRQRTLRALIDWSYDLLGPEERALLAKLSVFSGGWTLEAAEDVCGGGGSCDSVLEWLSRLVEKSLVSMEPGGDRYAMLETVRQYAGGRLRESQEEDPVRERHLEHFLRFAEQAKAGLVGPEQAAWLARVDRDRENVLAAFGTASARDAQLAMRLAGSVKLYFINRGLLDLGLRLTLQVLALANGDEKAMVRCRALYEAGQFLSYMGRYAEARERLEQSLQIARAHEDARAIAGVLQPLGMATLAGGDVVAARRYLEEALQRTTALGDDRQIAAAAIELGQLHRMLREHERAEALYGTGLELAMRLGDQETIAATLLNLAMLAIARGQPAQARDGCLRALPFAEQTSSRRMTQSVLDVCAALAASGGEWLRAARFRGAADAIAADTGLGREPADEALVAPLVETARRHGGSHYDREHAQGARLASADAAREARAWLEAAAPLPQPAGETATTR